MGTRRRDEARFDLNPDPAERRPRVAVPQPQAPAWPGDTITTSGFAITFADRLPAATTASVIANQGGGTLDHLLRPDFVIIGRVGRRWGSHDSMSTGLCGLMKIVWWPGRADGAREVWGRT